MTTEPLLQYVTLEFRDTKWTAPAKALLSVNVLSQITIALYLDLSTPPYPMLTARLLYSKLFPIVTVLRTELTAPPCSIPVLLCSTLALTITVLLMNHSAPPSQLALLLCRLLSVTVMVLFLDHRAPPSQLALLLHSSLSTTMMMLSVIHSAPPLVALLRCR